MNVDDLTAPDPAEIRSHVVALPGAVIRELALGPLEDIEAGDPRYATATAADDCRVCAALTRLAEHNVAGGGRAQLHARELLAYHDMTAVAFDWASESVDVDGPLSVWVLELLGALSFARCCQIYEAARAIELDA